MTKATEYMTRLSTRDIDAADRPDSDTLRDRCTAYVLQHIEHASPYHVEDLMDLVRDEVSRDVAQQAPNTAMSDARSDSGTVYTDQVIFDAILAAISDQSLSGGATMISVKKFIETFNNHRDRALCTSLSVAQPATPFTVAQLRHAYAQLSAGTVKDQKMFADGLIAPAIRALESGGVAQVAVDRDELVAILTDMASVNMSSEVAGRQANRMADALIAKGFGGSNPHD